MLDPSCFRYIEQLWGPHTVDHFASLQTRQQERCEENPRCEAVDTFTISWLKENNWIFPPPYLTAYVLKHMSAGGEIGTLVLPSWPSAVWWQLLVNTNGSWKAFITGIVFPQEIGLKWFIDNSTSFTSKLWKWQVHKLVLPIHYKERIKTDSIKINLKDKFHCGKSFKNCTNFFLRCRCE